MLSKDFLSDTYVRKRYVEKIFSIAGVYIVVFAPKIRVPRHREHITDAERFFYDKNGRVKIQILPGKTS